MIPLRINSLTELEAAFVSAVRQHADALLVGSSSIFTDRRVEIVGLAARHALPAAYARPTGAGRKRWRSWRYAGLTPEYLGTFVAAEIEKWARATKASGIQLD